MRQVLRLLAQQARLAVGRKATTASRASRPRTSSRKAPALAATPAPYPSPPAREPTPFADSSRITIRSPGSATLTLGFSWIFQSGRVIARLDTMSAVSESPIPA
jgi:hypothetical protein